MLEPFLPGRELRVISLLRKVSFGLWVETATRSSIFPQSPSTSAEEYEQAVGARCATIPTWLPITIVAAIIRRQAISPIPELALVVSFHPKRRGAGPSHTSSHPSFTAEL
jgi:hypothetical protein